MADDRTQADRVHELEDKVAELTAVIQRLVGGLSPSATPRAGEATEATASRRGMLKLAGAAAAGAVGAAVVGNAMPVAAATGDMMLVGQTMLPTSSADVTTLFGGSFYSIVDTAATYEYADSGFNAGGALLGRNTSTTNDNNVRAGVVGVGDTLIGAGGSAHGVAGINGTDSAAAAVLAFSRSDSVVAGLRTRSLNGPGIHLVADRTGVPVAGSWVQNSLLSDTGGNLWYCVNGGTPGTWRKLTGIGVAGGFHPISPVRVYDSRAAAPTPGAIASGANRTVSVADGRDLVTGAVNAAGIVPAGATAVFANVTIANTTAQGFLAINPGGNTTVAASAINWSASGQILANGLSLTLNASRQVTVIAGGGGATDFIIDISGYYL